MVWHRDRDAALLASLGELAAGHWLGIECACGRITKCPLKLLARQRGRTTLVRDVLPRLHCQHCKAAPTRVYLTDDATGGIDGETAWSVELVP